MLYFEARPDRAFREIVLTGLELIGDTLELAMNSDKDMEDFFSVSVCKIFSREELLAQLKKLHKAHLSGRIYSLTYYHLLVLHDIISIVVDMHNDLQTPDDDSLFSALMIKQIDLDQLFDSYFPDTDFLFSAADFDRLALSDKEALGFSDEIFGIVHGMKPNPDELEMKPVEQDESWKAPDIYKPGEAYPFFRDEPDEDSNGQLPPDLGMHPE